MKVVVLGYHSVGCVGIEALIAHGFEIAAVFTHVDDPHENVWFDSVAELAAAKGIPVYAPEDINHPVWENRIREMAPELIFSFYYRDMVRSQILQIPEQLADVPDLLIQLEIGGDPQSAVLANHRLGNDQLPDKIDQVVQSGCPHADEGLRSR